MIQVNCYNCSQSGILTDSVHCSHCDNVEVSRTSITENFHTLPANYEPASDGSTQTTDDDLSHFQLIQNASTQTTDSAFSFLAQINGSQEYLDGRENIYSSQVKALKAFGQDSAENQNLIPENPNTKKNDFLNMSFDRCNPVNFGPLLESIDGARVHPEQCTCFHEQPASNRYQNIRNGDNIFKTQRSEYAEQINETGKLNFAGSLSLLSENLIPKFYPESSVAVNQHGDSQEEIESSFVPSGKRTNPSVSSDFSGNVATTKVPEQEAHYSGKSRRNFVKKKLQRKRLMRCKNCAKRCKSESTLHDHLQNKCNQNHYKCDQCFLTFPTEIGLLCHELVHTTEKMFKCDQCDFTSKLGRHLKSHKERCHKKLTCQYGILKIPWVIFVSSLYLAILYKNLLY